MHCVTTTMQRTICSTNEPLWTCCNGNCTRDKTKNATFFGVKNYPLLRFDTYYYIIIMHSLHTLNLWMFKKSVSNCLIIYSFKCKKCIHNFGKKTHLFIFFKNFKLQQNIVFEIQQYFQCEYMQYKLQPTVPVYRI